MCILHRDQLLSEHVCARTARILESLGKEWTRRVHAHFVRHTVYIYSYSAHCTHHMIVGWAGLCDAVNATLISTTSVDVQRLQTCLRVYVMLISLSKPISEYLIRWKFWFRRLIEVLERVQLSHETFQCG